MITEILAAKLIQILSDITGYALKKPIAQLLDQHALHRSLVAAIKRAEKRFYSEYRFHDSELINALVQQAHFADLPSVQNALQEMLTHPFHDPTQQAIIIQHSFSEVLPMQVDRTRVDEAVTAFLHYLGQEVLHIPELQRLYELAFQRVQTENTRIIASNTASVVESIRGMQDDIKQLPNILTTLAPLASPLQLEVRSHPRYNLPQQSFTHFIGRQKELDKLYQLMLPHPLSRHFLVTLDGIGGVGKSAIALELAFLYRDNYDKLSPEERFEAIIWVSAKRSLLTGSGIQQRQQTFSNLSDLFREIGAALDEPTISQAALEQRRGMIERALSCHRTLLIVDNLETVDDEELLSFLRELPDPTKAIVTTRHRIDIAYSIRLTGLPYNEAKELMKLEAERKNVELSSDTADNLYRRTGGIPLAIVWSIGLLSLGYGIDSVLRRLGSGHSDIARFCFEESLVRIRERDAYKLLLVLALFESSVNRHMLGEVAGLDGDEIGRDDGLAELLQLSLINQEVDRFSLLPLTRSYVLDELTQQPKLEQKLRERWITHLTSLAHPFVDLYWRWPDMRLIQQEGIHLVTLANWCQQASRPDILLQILPALSSYYDITGQLTDMLRIGEVGIEYARLIGDLRSIVLTETHIFVWVLSQEGRHTEAERAINNALIAAKQISDPAWSCETLVCYSQVMRRKGAFDEASDRCRQALQLIVDWPDSRQIYVRADIENELGAIACMQEDWQQAQKYFLEAQKIFRHDDSDPAFNIERAWTVYSNLGLVTHKLMHFDSAAQIYEQCLNFFKNMGSKPHMVITLVRRASLEEQRGNLANAIGFAREALEWNKKLHIVEVQGQAEAICERLKFVYSQE